MWGTGGQLNFPPAANAGISHSTEYELLNRIAINIQPVGLINWFVIPIEADPPQIVDQLLVRAAFDARAVQVLDPEPYFPALLPRQ
jgi:hypothetical protein